MLVEFNKKYKSASEKFLKRKIETLKTTKSGQAFKPLESMGAQSGECTEDTTFTLPSHQAAGLTLYVPGGQINPPFRKLLIFL